MRELIDTMWAAGLGVWRFNQGLNIYYNSNGYSLEEHERGWCCRHPSGHEQVMKEPTAAYQLLKQTVERCDSGGRGSAKSETHVKIMKEHADALSQRESKVLALLGPGWTFYFQDETYRYGDYRLRCISSSGDFDGMWTCEHVKYDTGGGMYSNPVNAFNSCERSVTHRVMTAIDPRQPVSIDSKQLLEVHEKLGEVRNQIAAALGLPIEQLTHGMD